MGKSLGFLKFVAIFFCMILPPAHAAGLLRLESDGFLRDSVDRPSSSYIFTVGPEFEAKGKVIEGKFDLKAMTYLSDTSSLTMESHNAYVATSRDWMARHQLTVGRRQYDWSVVDDYWKLGFWEPRFLWDPLRPEQIGLTGAFYEHHSSVWRILAYASPISIPERSYPVRNVGGKLSSSSPYFIPRYDRVSMLRATVDIKYMIHTPEYRDVLFRPAGALQAKYGREQGYWVSVGYGVMPIHQMDLAVDASLNLGATPAQMDTNIYPRFPMHHLLTAESGYHGRFWSLWTSVSGEQPLTVATEPGWISNSTGPALLSAAGGSLVWQEGLTLSTSYLFVLEKNRGLTGPPIAGTMDLTLPDRFSYRRALVISGDWNRGSPTTYGVRWTNDSTNQSNLFSLELKHHPRWRTKLYRNEKWTFNLGADMIASSTGKGVIGQYNGDDRVRGGVSYVF
ncbi:MAG: hypothetical protein HYW49_04890 [Deltaproteobacteria bacterium]|nr:hypothetical protein [Deltaproteobacteria bacterium]